MQGDIAELKELVSSSFDKYSTERTASSEYKAGLGTRITLIEKSMEAMIEDRKIKDDRIFKFVCAVAVPIFVSFSYVSTQMFVWVYERWTMR